MSLIKSATLTLAKLAANRASARRSTGPSMAAASQVCEYWHADEAAYVIYRVDGTNPRCPLESTDRNPVSSLFPFYNSPGHGFNHAERGRGLSSFSSFAPVAESKSPPQGQVASKDRELRRPFAAHLKVAHTYLCDVPTNPQCPMKSTG